MKKLFLFSFIIFPLFLFSQPKMETVLDLNILKALINESSGSLQLKNLYDIFAYEHDRTPNEFADLFKETKYFNEKAKEYGFSDVKIEKWKGRGKAWDGELGELWITNPEKKLLISFRDDVSSLAPNSNPGTYEGELVYVGKGNSPDDYKNINVEGKIILGDASINELYRIGVQRFKAKGILSSNLHHMFDNPDKIANQSLPFVDASTLADSIKHHSTFAFSISPRMAKELADLYYSTRGSRRNNAPPPKPIQLKAVVKATYRDWEDQMVSATIPGDGSLDEEVCLSAHLFEGLYKQGANDDGSGCITLLDVGRTLIKLINEGVISKPARTIRFIWVPEISGSYWFLANHKDIAKKIKLNINLDMVGEDTHKNLNTLVFYQNLYSRAFWTDDVTADLMEWVNKNCSERLETRGFSYGFQIFDPIGTRHPFYHSVEPWSSGSDHIVFNMQNFKIPSVFFNNWPDVNYHTTFDRPTFSDATELKRISVITSALSILTGTTKEADFYRIANIIYGRILQRLGQGLTKELNELNFSPLENIAERFRDAKYIIQAHIERETNRFNSLLMLATNPTQQKEYSKYLKSFNENFDKLEKGFIKEIESSYEIICKNKSIDAKNVSTSDVEKEMASFIPEDIQANEIKEDAGFFRGDNVQIEGLSPRYTSELKYFVDGKRSILNIRNMVSAEFEPVPLEPTLKYFKELEKTKYLKLRKK